jgi:hypothetical protein
MSDIDIASKALTTVGLVDKLTTFESEHRPFINLIIKPMFMLLIFLAIGYYTMWMSTNYVKQDKFVEYMKIQQETDKRQDENDRIRFEATQIKLETIINNQTSFSEQLKAYNQLMANYQKQLDGQNDRIMWLERRNKDR